MESIFDAKDGLPDLPVPRMDRVEIIDVPDRRAEPSSSLGQAAPKDGKGLCLRVINFDANLSEEELDQKQWGTSPGEMVCDL